ncbi:Asp-tRNA(Asn)/Glu-tRNA(Gln) amidotransferase A subunit family amidase [Paraburkholderia sp. UCT70]
MKYGSKCVSAPTVLDAADRIRNGCLTPAELIAHSLKAIETHNPTLNAFGDIYAETAAAEAETLTREASRGCFRGPLHGIPFGVKDLFSTAGLRTTRGSLTALDYVPSDDAPIIRRLKDAGAIILGKTATTEFESVGAARACRAYSATAAIPGTHNSRAAAPVRVRRSRSPHGWCPRRSVRTVAVR